MFGEQSSVRADGLCIGCLGQWAEGGRENSNMQEFFRTTLYACRGLLTALKDLPDLKIILSEVFDNNIRHISQKFPATTNYKV